MQTESFIAGDAGRGICALPYVRSRDGATVWFPVNIILKTSLEAAEITEDTEMKRIFGCAAFHPAGDGGSIAKPLVFLCELCALCG